MPLIKISMYPGRSTEQKSEFARAVTKAATEILGAKDRHVIVVFEENPSENWFQAGKPL
ncbi:MAG: 4-oxalocrotonate tautomerase family protein [Cenarchaeum sp. SB0665_bin_23]|nr:4-oxalocrotonate tautomerase family protein [Cenarchaeum sp. SB0667_bin_13]MXY37538.1 4-oxalocrotonate tautomerase family protein [Cenarchaeum sp. SB0664_bin_35]MXY61156.1 4-oxalocrotonate tautomerase family protein [Cenarchaeum sp. SB0665_bin_23]MXZ93213.1 4-oxalocrotonate tautomerase family protein [Cenarchaeum sp. SB0666_bin_15]MYB46788.1 4-oxalocrotonate tautomerase family protein [Cenarchaeum sp. SB0662_bin_33]MYC79755.1 4-oxalocrotonate tautomerase family protein [Cenarchaeum sp. SB06